MNRLQPVPWTRVRIDGGFWGSKLETIRTATLPAEYHQLESTGRIDALCLRWRPGDANPPHVFWESDVAKWIEAAAYSLATHPDPELEALVDGVVSLLETAQRPDGYLNAHFTVVEPAKRWSNLRDMHELYCAGHLIEAAVAYYQATGKDTLLRVMRRYADYIGSVFGRGDGQKRGYCGHEEIELALVRLYRATGERRYLDLASYFVDERGRRPHYYDLEERSRGEEPGAPWHGIDYRYVQSHLPVREQTEAVGHAVRAGYLYCAMADLAAETGDETLLPALHRLWENVTQRRMYITAGIGSAGSGERFTYDYDLPNATAYAETCATIALAFWAHRMLQLEPKGVYADVFERAIYNGILSGISLDGRRFFYVNRLELDYEDYRLRRDIYGEQAGPEPGRQDWFGCSCCPPNIARLLLSLGGYAYSQGEGAIHVHHYLSSSAEVQLVGGKVALRQETDYPWGEAVSIAIELERAMQFELAVRIPGWCRGATLEVNGTACALETDDGYARLRRSWQPGDRVRLHLPMPVELIEAHPEVRADAGRVALQRGPLVYCLEEEDNGPNLQDICVGGGEPFQARWEPGLFGGVVALDGKGFRRERAGWQGRPYRPVDAQLRPTPLRAIPCYAWANRELGDMLVWLRQCPAR